jgi:NADPH:quinone reductase-like Zn-dependent oxidoreductase
VLRELGVADEIVVSTEPDAVEQVRSLTNGHGADVVLDNLAAPDAWTLTIGGLAAGGVIVTSGAKFGGRVEVDLRSLYTFNQRIIGVRTSNHAAKDRLWQLVAENALRPLVDSVIPLEEVADAHRRIEAGHNIGRVVLAV